MDVKDYQSRVSTKNGLIMVKSKSSFFVDSSFKRKTCYVVVVVVNNSVKPPFSEIRKLALEEFHYVGLMDVFKHELGFMIFLFGIY